MKHLNLSPPPACSGKKIITFTHDCTKLFCEAALKTRFWAAHFGIFLSLKFLFYNWDL